MKLLRRKIDFELRIAIAILLSVSILCPIHTAYCQVMESIDELGVRKFKEGKFDEAIVLLESLLYESPNSLSGTDEARVTFYLGFAYFAKSKSDDSHFWLDKAKRLYTNALILQPNLLKIDPYLASSSEVESYVKSILENSSEEATFYRAEFIVDPPETVILLNGHRLKDESKGERREIYFTRRSWPSDAIVPDTLIFRCKDYYEQNVILYNGWKLKRLKVSLFSKLLEATRPLDIFVAVDASLSTREKRLARQIENKIVARLTKGKDRIERFGFAAHTELINLPSSEDYSDSASFRYKFTGIKEDECQYTRFDNLFRKVGVTARKAGTENPKALIVVSDGIPDTMPGVSPKYIESLPEYVSLAVDSLSILNGQLLAIFMVINETRDGYASYAKTTKEAWDEKLKLTGGGAFFSTTSEGYDAVIDTIFSSLARRECVTIQKNLEAPKLWNPNQISSVFREKKQLDLPLVIRLTFNKNINLRLSQLKTYVEDLDSETGYSEIFSSGSSSGGFIWGFRVESQSKEIDEITLDTKPADEFYSKLKLNLCLATRASTTLNDNFNYLFCPEFVIANGKENNSNLLIFGVDSIEIGKFWPPLRIKPRSDFLTIYAGYKNSLPFVVEFSKTTYNPNDSLIIIASLDEYPAVSEFHQRTTSLKDAVIIVPLDVTPSAAREEVDIMQGFKFYRKYKNSRLTPHGILVSNSDGKNWKEDNLVYVQLRILFPYKLIINRITKYLLPFFILLLICLLITVARKVRKIQTFQLDRRSPLLQSIIVVTTLTIILVILFIWSRSVGYLPVKAIYTLLVFIPVLTCVALLAALLISTFSDRLGDKRNIIASLLLFISTFFAMVSYIWLFK